MIKLSELKNEDELFFGNYVVTKEEILSNLDLYKEKISTDDSYQLQSTDRYDATVSAESILYRALEEEAKNMYEGWEDSVRSEVLETDIQKIQLILDEILNRNKKSNTCYYGKELVEIDM